jgi:serine acetyltransferase
MERSSKTAVTIGDHVWIGAHVIILPGVLIGQHAAVGARSVVTRDILPIVWRLAIRLALCVNLDPNKGPRSRLLRDVTKPSFVSATATAPFRRFRD